MKKLLIMVILAMTVAGCELFDANRWDRVNREAKEKAEHVIEEMMDIFIARINMETE